MKTKEVDFHEMSATLNGLLDHNKIYNVSELLDLFRAANIPAAPAMVTRMVELQILHRQETKGAYKFQNEPVHCAVLQKAYTIFRRMTHESMAKSKIQRTAVSEAMIQEAIKLLKNQGDRFEIKEKVITINYKTL